MSSYPHSLEAERALLGQILTDPVMLRRDLAAFDPAWLYRPDHRRIIVELRRLQDAGVAFDLVTLPRLLSERGWRPEDVQLVLELPGCAPSTANMSHYVDVVREHHVRREMIRAGEEIATAAQRHQGAASELHETVVGQLRSLLAAGSGSGEAVDVSVNVDEALSMAEQAEEARLSGVKRNQLVLSTGYPVLDDMMGGGLRRGHLTVVAARPGMGKTGFVGDLLARAAEDSLMAPPDQPQEHCLFLSLEMSGPEMATRWLARMTDIPHHAISSGRLTNAQWTSLVNAQEALRSYPLRIWNRRKQSGNQILGAIYATAAKVPLRLVALDYAQVVRVPASERRDLALSDFISDFKDCCAEVGAAGILVSQFGRSLKASGGIPTLEALKESGGLEEHADNVLGLDRPALRGEDHAPHWLYIHGIKCRSGGPFIAEAYFDGSAMKVDVLRDVTLGQETEPADARPAPPPAEY